MELVLLVLAIAVVVGIPAFIAIDATRSSRLVERGERLPGAAPPPPPPRLSTADVGLTGWGGAFVDPGGEEEQLLLFLFPCATPAAFAELEKINEKARGRLAALIVFNHGDEGALCASRVARLFEPPLLLASAADRPIDRGVEESASVKARPLETLAAERLAIRPVGSAVALGELGASTLLGVEVPMETIAQERPTAFVGTISAGSDQIPRRFAEWLIDPHGRSPQVVLVNTGPGARVLDWTSSLEPMGVNVTVLGGSTRSPAVRVDEIIGEIATGELEGAERSIAALLEEHPDLGAAWFQRAVIRAIRRDLPGSIEAFERAATAPRPSPEAWTSVAALCIEQGDLDRAKDASRRAVEALPRDPIGIRTAVLALIIRGETDAARALLAERGAALPEPVREELEATISSGTTVAFGAQRFTVHADLSVERAHAALDAGDRAAAERILRHALVLDPSHLPAQAALQQLP